MTKKMFFILTAAVMAFSTAMFVSSCSSDEDITASNNNDDDDDDDDDVTTGKVAFVLTDMPTGTQEAGKRYINWSSNDSIGVFCSKITTAENYNVLFKKQDANKNGVFASKLAFNGNDVHTFYAYCPYNLRLTGVHPNTTTIYNNKLSATQSATTSVAQNDFMYGTGTGVVYDTIRMTMKHTFHYIDFKITAASKFLTYNVDSIKYEVADADIALAGTFYADLTAADPANAVTFTSKTNAVKLASNINFLSTRAQTNTMVVNAADLSATTTKTTIYLSNGTTKIAVYSFAAGQNLKPQEVTEFNINVDDMYTAVYYGKANSATATGATTLNVNIAPYCTKSEVYAYQNLTDANIPVAKSAKILWQVDENGAQSNAIVNSVAVAGNNLSVTTSGNAGNALVAIFDANDKMLWSFHIWALASAISTKTYSAAGLSGLQFMDRNLGATSAAEADGAKTYGLMYQWGRKDPFCNVGSVSAMKVGSVEIVTLMPDKIDNAWGNALTDRTWQNLWGNPNTSSSAPNTAGGVKSVYDPCPAGYRVPPQNAWAGFESSTWNSVNKGITINTGGATTWYPAFGYRNYTDGTLANAEYGYYWSNSAYTSTDINAGGFYISPSAVTPLFNYGRANAFAVRCVTE